jgi:2-polyprenyl-3-methyl-5-hydroxy-6-metoxy-1,4-benzoquinol methylase
MNQEQIRTPHTPRKAYKPGFMVNGNRWSKAEKIRLILNEAQNQKIAPTCKQQLLDIGTGNGKIAGYLSESFDVTSVDVLDQRTHKEGYKFVQLNSERLPFPDKYFDLVVSNHVIEHVKDADLHLSEISRVLKSDGLVYLATPNKLWPKEVHNKVYFLHYLPARTFNALLKRMGRHHEDVYLLTWHELRRKALKYFTINIVSDKICKWPLKYHMQCPPMPAKLLSMMPLVFFRMMVFLYPTLVVVLKNE